MTELEQKLLEKLRHWKKTGELVESICQDFKILQESIGVVTKTFLNDEMVSTFIKDKALRGRFIDEEHNISLPIWFFIQTKPMVEVKEEIVKRVLAYKKDKCEKGQVLPPPDLYSPTLIRSVYRSNNQELIEIFMAHLPHPPLSLFKGGDIPEVIIRKDHEIKSGIQSILDKYKLSLEELTKRVIRIQRLVSAKQRYRKEVKRITSNYAPYDRNNLSAQHVIANANKPYPPQCDKKLAARILLQSEKVTLFTEVSHWTSLVHIRDIFNDALYGRERLIEFLKFFKSSALHVCDVRDGDGNVICLAPQEIDPLAIHKNHALKLVFDLQKISSENPTLFFKARDFGYELNRIRTTPLKDMNLFFSHTNPVKESQDASHFGFSYLSIYESARPRWYREYRHSLARGAGLPNCSLISSNVTAIHQILTLNFFKFIDTLPVKEKEGIYSQLNALDDNELLLFLKSIGKHLSDTSEFNIYGAHQIDFSTLIEMAIYEKKKLIYTLHFPSLLSSLEEGNMELLTKAMDNIPQAFESYRFLDYLISQTNSPSALQVLQDLRARCEAPSWITRPENPEAGVSLQK